MSSSTEVRDFSDIYTEILNKMRQQTGVTALNNQAKRYANTALHDMVFGFEYKLPWLEREGFLTTMGPYTTGTVEVARGSTTVTGTSTLWTTANVYNVNNARTTGKLNFGDHNYYTISAVGGAGTITMNQRYIADADLPAGSEYTYFEDEYALASDFLKLVDVRRLTAAYDIPIIGREEFRRNYPRPLAGLPKVATLLDKSFVTTSTQPMYVQLYPYPNANLMIPYAYITKNLAVSSAGVEATSMSSDTDEPALPVRYRNALVSFACWKWYRDKKDDARAEGAHADYIDEVSRIVTDQRIGANTTVHVTPRVGHYVGQAKAPYGGSAGKRYSTNDSFDYFR